MPHQVNAGDLHPAPQHGLIHRPRQDEPRQILLKTGPGGAHGPAPAGQQLAARQIDAGPRHIFVGGDGLQCLAGRLFVVEHHGRFAGVADGPRHQFQVVIRIEPQRQQGDAGQQHTGHADRRQGRHQVGASQTLSQGETLVGGRNKPIMSPLIGLGQLEHGGMHPHPAPGQGIQIDPKTDPLLADLQAEDGVGHALGAVFADAENGVAAQPLEQRQPSLGGHYPR